MRLALSNQNGALLLIETKNTKKRNRFDFYVVNGGWAGKYTNGRITVYEPDDISWTSLDKMTIITDNQDRLRGDYNDVFFHLDNPEYIAPKNDFYDWNDDENDIPF